MEDQQVLNNTGNAILEKPVTVKIDIIYPTWYERMMIKTGRMKPYREFIVRPATIDKFIRISQLLLSVDHNLFDKEDAQMSVARMATGHAKELAECIAVMLHPGYDTPPALTRFILLNLTNRELQALALMIVEQSDAASFLSSIVSMKGVNLLAKETSPQSTEEIIAFGDLSDNS